jgi:hypothetical protein
MANDYDTTAKDVMLNALAAVMTQVHLHSADPGAANSNTSELSGGGYARIAIAWNTSAGGAIDDTGTPLLQFNVGAGGTVAWVSFWNGANTVRYAKKQVTTENFGAAGTYTLTDVDFDLNDP